MILLSCFPLPNHTQPSSPALHTSCGLKERPLSESWTAAHFSSHQENLSRATSFSVPKFSLCPAASSSPSQGGFQASVDSQVLLHHPSTPIAWSPPLLCQKPQYSPVPCTPSYNALLLGDSKHTHKLSIKALTPIPEPLMGTNTQAWI